MGPNRFSLKSRGHGSPQAKLYQPSIDLSEGVLLPLIRSVLAERVETFHELPHAGRAEIIHVAEFLTAAVVRSS